MAFQCRHCGLAFEIKQKLGGHSRTCRMNPRFEDSVAQLNEARKNAKTSLELVVCSVCDKTLTKSGMNLHVWQVHGAGASRDPNIGFKQGTRVSWSKGKTKETDARIARIAQKTSKSMMGKRRSKLQRSKAMLDLQNYRLACRFCFNVYDFPDEFDLSLIEKHGWYKAKNRGNNPTGVSRDHIVSVRYGFDNQVDPNIMSHPANCCLLSHASNVSKGKKCSISIDELVERIDFWNRKYPVKGR